MKATLEGYKNVEPEAAEIAARNAERETKRRQSNFLINYIMGDNNDSSSLIGGLIDLSNNPEADMWKSLVNMGAYGGHLYDGWTEPTGLMNRKRLDDIQDLNNNILDFEKNASSNNNGFSTITDAETGEVGQIMGITPDGTYRTVYPSGTYNMTLDLPNTDVLGSKARMKAVRGLDAPLVGGELKDNQYRTMPTNSEADAFADAWTEQTAPTVGHLISAGLKPLDLITPSKYVGLLDSDNKNGLLHLFNDNNRGFFIGNDPTKPFSKQFHDEHPFIAGLTNMVGDVAAGYGIGKILNASAPYAINGYNTAIKAVRNNIVMPLTFKYSTNYSNMPNVYRRFRNQELRNFFQTRSGDNYYRLTSPYREGLGYSPQEKYFVSHTTPWDEFLNSSYPEETDPKLIADLSERLEGSTMLYEFPTDVFGKLKASDYRGIVGNSDVKEMGINHLLYGDTSSGKRGLVRIMSDEDADFLRRSPYEMGIIDRPLDKYGYYDVEPVYEDIFHGNQTVINGEDINKAIQGSTYNIFKYSPFELKEGYPMGLIKIHHVGK